ncbi:hypothetical protein AcV5_009809 [Taiwanofungus camphoratus]|nr:hypothetical protein AcV5_009809 [Antrodia cinnamomea]
MSPLTSFDLEAVLVGTKQAFGYELYGYWLYVPLQIQAIVGCTVDRMSLGFLIEELANKSIESHWDSAFSIIYPSDPRIWKMAIASRGALKAWILADKKAPLTPYLTEQEKQHITQIMLKNGLAAPLSWYKAMVSGIATEDDKCTHLPISIFPQRYRTCQIGVQLSIDIPQERLVIHYPGVE